jgi:hypothetical protein
LFNLIAGGSAVHDRIDHSVIRPAILTLTRMRRLVAKLSESEASNHTPPLAGFTTITLELSFRYTQGTGQRKTQMRFTIDVQRFDLVGSQNEMIYI